MGSHSEVGMNTQTLLVQHRYGPQSALLPHFFIPPPLIPFCSCLFSFLRFEFLIIINILRLSLYHTVMINTFSVTAISNRARSCYAASEWSDTSINLFGRFSAEFL